jgi:cold shock CspA family protein
MAAVSIPASFGSVRPGVVQAFDDHVGAGTVRDALDGTEWWFHCTRIAGGRRTVPIGATVWFRVTTGPTGLEAGDVEVRTAPPA